MKCIICQEVTPCDGKLLELDWTRLPLSPLVTRGWDLQIFFKVVLFKMELIYSELLEGCVRTRRQKQQGEIWLCNTY